MDTHRYARIRTDTHGYAQDTRRIRAGYAQDTRRIRADTHSIHTDTPSVHSVIGGGRHAFRNASMEGSVLHAFEAEAAGQLSLQQNTLVLLQWQTTEVWCFVSAGFAASDRFAPTSEHASGLVPTSHLQPELPDGWMRQLDDEGAISYVHTDGRSQRVIPFLPCRAMDDEEDAASLLSSGSFTTVASATSEVRREGKFGSRLRAEMVSHLAAARGGAEEHVPLSSLQLVEEEELVDVASAAADEVTTVSPWDSISNAGGETQPADRGSGRARADSVSRGAIRLKASDGSTRAAAGIKIVRPDSLVQLRQAASGKAALLWPASAAAAVTTVGMVGAVVDEDGCEVFEDNYQLVGDGALLYVSWLGPTVAAESAATMATPMTGEEPTTAAAELTRRCSGTAPARNGVAAMAELGAFTPATYRGANALSGSEGEEAQLRALVAMGFSETAASAALRRAAGSVEAAVQLLLDEAAQLPAQPAADGHRPHEERAAPARRGAA